MTAGSVSLFDGSSPRVRGKQLGDYSLQAKQRIIPASAGQTDQGQSERGLGTDHPRECGANVGGVNVVSSPFGSSPRVRGKLALRLKGLHLDRIIPASAGQTFQTCSFTVIRSDHPRECGANMMSNVSLHRAVGSSPRVRGKHVFDDYFSYDFRIIPASAGQTHGKHVKQGRWTDHPRECGANVVQGRRFAVHRGSSPRVRGERRHVRQRLRRRDRIIPASAGQTRGRSSSRKNRSDHPRECGANGAGRVPYRRGQGSSPRVRGKQSHQRDGAAPRRIIPASAGQTGQGRAQGAVRSDHPRECGANGEPIVLPWLGWGSSPRVRGKPRARRQKRVRGRIIPASAGQTSLALWPAPIIADHPRECGANVIAWLLAWISFGSSPRVRGKRCRPC